MLQATKLRIVWDKEPRKIDADPVATLNLERSDWQALGAVFHRRADNSGEKPWLATGCLYTAHSPVEVGVLDYDGDSTYLLLPGDDHDQQYNLLDVFKTLVKEDVIEEGDILASIPFKDEYIEAQALLNSPEMLEAIDRAEEQVASGTTIPLDEL